MADIITTEYDDDSGNDFIQCEYCDKSIRGDTQYRIHLTTNQHLKKMESMGLKDDMPVWENFLDYLDYLRLDEPIIGLGVLEQLDPQVLGNGQFRLRYKCRMCNLEADLPAMASHVVGRKHRQKFLELRRPDLVTWDKFSINQQGKVIRAKAEVVERQEGRGVPLNMHTNKRNSKWNGRQRGPPNPRYQNQRQDMGPQQGGLDRDHLRYDPQAMNIPPQDFPEDPHYQEKPLDDDYAFRRGADYPEDASHRRGYPEEDDRFRPSFPDQQYPRDHHREEPYPKDRRGPFPDEPLQQAYGKGDRYEPSYYEDLQRPPQPGDDHQHPYVDDRHSGQRHPDRDDPRRAYEGVQAQAYQENEPPRQHTDYNHGKRLHSERDSSGYSYPQVDHRQPAVSEEYRQAYPEEDAYDGRDQEDVGRGPYSRPYSKDGPSDWHPKIDTDRRFHGRDDEHYTERGFEPHHSSQDYRSDRSYSGFDPERNRGGEARYGGEMPESRLERDQAGARAPRLRGSETLERHGSNFPQNQGASHLETAATRKRRSRFTDCTEAEKELLQKCQMAQVVSQKLAQNPPTKVQRRSENARLREDYREHGGAQQDPGNVLDVLKDVQIESVEEANFLKNKLCSLLKEFQANKSGPRGDSPMGSREFEQPRREVQERPRSEDYNYQMRDMAAAERDHDIQQPSPSVDYGFRSREMSAAERGYDEMQKQPPYEEYSYRMREMATAGRGHDEIQERLPSDDYNYPRREIMDVGRGPDNFRQVSPERFDRRSYEREQSRRRGEIPRPAEMFENYPRDDLNRGEFRSSPPGGSLRFREGSQRPFYDRPFEEDPRDFHPQPGRMPFDEERRNPPSNLDKIASTLLQLVAHK